MARTNHLIFDFAKSEFGNLRHVRRFTGCFLNHQESVAEHHWYVTLLVNLMCVDINANLKKGQAPINIGVALQRAVMHDIEEGVTGDFPRPFKYSDKDLKKQLDIAAEKGCRRMLKSLKLSTTQTEEHELCWQTAKQDDREGAIVGFADLVAFLELVWHEVRSGNKHIIDYTSEVSEYLERFEHRDYDVIHRYLYGAWYLYNEILNEVGKSSRSVQRKLKEELSKEIDLEQRE